MVSLGKSMSETVRYLQQQMGAWYYNRVDIAYPPEQREAIQQRVESAKPADVGGSPLSAVNTIDGYKFQAADGSWLLIRFSGTEPLLRIYTETTSPERVQRVLDQGRRLAGV
jgi:phosphomannomutase